MYSRRQVLGTAAMMYETFCVFCKFVLTRKTYANNKPNVYISEKYSLTLKFIIWELQACVGNIWDLRLIKMVEREDRLSEGQDRGRDIEKEWYGMILFIVVIVGTPWLYRKDRSQNQTTGDNHADMLFVQHGLENWGWKWVHPYLKLKIKQRNG